MTNRFEIQRMVTVARMYYENEMTQQEIAKIMGITRQSVSQMILAAKEKGIIKISIFDPGFDDPEIEKKLINAFNLHEVILTQSEGLEANALRARIGMAGADYLSKVLPTKNSIGIGWGRTLYEAVNYLPGDQSCSCHVIPLIGGIGDMTPYFQVNELVRKLAEAFRSPYRYIYAPAFTRDSSILKSLSTTDEVGQIMDLWTKLDTAIVGIGHVEFQNQSRMFFADHISSETISQLKAKQAVGDVCGRFFNIEGDPINIEPGVISINLKQLQRIPEVIGIAGGHEKIDAILGALNAGFIKTLITDLATAKGIIAKHEERRRPGKQKGICPPHVE